ncbi:hypothetical protein ACFTUC_38920 [Streptomyces sp. NPDC056944]|uniref:hypothetical protein n=1 Tax=unclassified Streptomyces TaxID=2593676 RepID=UPI00363058D0
MYEAIRIEQKVLQRKSDDGLQPFVPPSQMPQNGSDGTVDSRWLPAPALWDLVNLETSLLHIGHARFLRDRQAREDANRDLSWVYRLPATEEDRRRRDTHEFLGPCRPGAPWWEGLQSEARAAEYQEYGGLRNLPRTAPERLVREVTALGLSADK